MNKTELVERRLQQVLVALRQMSKKASLTQQ